MINGSESADKSMEEKVREEMYRPSPGNKEVKHNRRMGLRGKEKGDGGRQGGKCRGQRSEGVSVPYSHLQVGDELSHCDLLSNLLVQTLAVQDHALQDGQGPLEDRYVHHGLAHVPCNL